MNRKDIEIHISVVGWLQIVNSLINLLVAAFVVAILLAVGAIADDPIAYRFLAAIGWLTGGLLFVLALPGLIVGIGLLGRAGWSRIMALVVAVFEIVAFPIGTVLAAYTIYIMLQKAAEDAFGPRPATQGSRVQTVSA